MTVQRLFASVTLLLPLAGLPSRPVVAQQPVQTPASAQTVAPPVARVDLDQIASDVERIRRFQDSLVAKNAADKKLESDHDKQVRLKLYEAAGRTSERFLYTVVIGTTATFSGSGIARNEINWTEATSPWRSFQIRNGYDKVKPWMDGVGTLALGVATALRSSTGKYVGISGSTVLLASNFLKNQFGTNENKLLNASGALMDSLRTGIEQISLSRRAYDQILVRRALANDYYTRSKNLLVSMRDLRSRLQILSDSMQTAQATNEGQLVDSFILLIDDLLSNVTNYETVAAFMDDYTKQLSETYSVYSKAFPALAPQFTIAKSDVDDFRLAFEENVRKPWLSELPKYRVLLSDLRSEMKKARPVSGSQ